MKGTALTGVYTPKLRVLRPVLEAWIEVVNRYCEVQSHWDNPWWFNERASLSTLAGAAWSLPNWVALEEYVTTKRGPLPTGRVDEDGVRKDRKGRCDLFIRNKAHHFAIEAKQAWQSIGPQSHGTTYVHPAMKKAWKDAGKLRLDEADHRLAVTFVVPYLPASALEIAEPNVWIKEWLDSSPFNVSQRSPAAVAYVFPKNWKRFKGENIDGYFPGVVLVIEHRRRANRE